MKKIFYLIPILVLIAGCDLETPEIHGVVLDAETKQPVENAWISSTLAVTSKTIAGDVSSYLSVDPPHTRTDKNGKFVIPSKKFSGSIGTSIDSFSINASTIDDKSGGFYMKDYQGKREIEVVVYVAPWKKGLADEGEYFLNIQSLYNYCLSGRFSVERPEVKEGCDAWELDYAITKHERYLVRYFKDVDKIKTSEQKSHYLNTLESIGSLYRKKGDFSKALGIFKKAKEFTEQHYQPPIFWLKGYEIQINELQQKLQEDKDKGGAR